MNQANDLHADQVREGQRREGTLHLANRASRPRRSAEARPKQFVAKGHDAILKELQDARARISIVTMSDATPVTGVLVGRDKYTITIGTEDGRRITIYKHAIESFEPAQQVQ